MKLFKKAVLATAIFGAVGVNAAVLSSDPIKLSAEGVAAGNVAVDANVVIDFVVQELTPAASTITLSFDDKVDLSVLAATLTGEQVITNNVGAGTGQTAGGEIAFNYGTGSFTFDRLVVDDEENTISFEVNLGNPVTANSAFRMTIAGDADAVVDDEALNFSGASVVSYSSVDSSDVSIETGSGVLATAVSQFDFAITTPYNGKIERLVQETFAKNGETALGATSTTTDTLSYYLVDNADNLNAPLTVTGTSLKLEGNFDNGKTVALDKLQAADFTPNASFNTAFDSATFTLANPSTDGVKTTGTVEFVSGGVIPETGDIAGTLTLATTNDDAEVVNITLTTEADAGSWALDATVVNVPYLPVGFDGLNTSVHFANESANVADVIVTAIDQKGNKYSGTMADLAGDTVTKYSQVAIMDALKAPAGSKLSVTFNIDANEGDVKAYAFSNAGTGRQALVTSQQDGK